MAVRILVVVAARQFADLPVKAFAASVRHTGLAPAIAAPVPEGFDDLSKRWAVSEHRAPFPHRDVVGGIEAYGREVSERANLASSIFGPHRIARIFNNPEIVPLSGCHHRIEVE